MPDADAIPAAALRYELEVPPSGRVELQVPFSGGTKVVVFVIEEEGSFDDLAAASQSSLEFWNNPLDDEDWKLASRPSSE